MPPCPRLAKIGHCAMPSANQPEQEERPDGALEPVEQSVELGGLHEPGRLVEWVSGGLLVFFVADLLVVRRPGNLRRPLMQTC